ncbi:MAG TPA: hypothetical protein VF255_01545 [Solirubrobacterales bacterium]
MPASAAPPVVEETDVARRTDTSAQLVGYLNPGGEPTTYHFEYGTTASYGSEAPVSGGDAGSGSEAVFVSQALPNLSPGTTYHYRLVAANGSDTVAGPDRTFTTRVDAPPPPARVYEQISPVDKNDYEVNSGPVTSADQQGGVLYYSFGSFPGSQSGAAVNGYLSRRGSGGWSVQPVNPVAQPTPLVMSMGILFNAPDLSSSVLIAQNPAHTPEAFQDAISNAYVLDNESAQITGTVTEATKAPVVEGVNPEASVMGASNDLEHVFFKSAARLLPEAPEGSPAVYRWTEGSGLEVISVDPESGLPIPGTWPREAVLALADLHMASEDGKRAFFSADGRLYLWEEGAGSTVVSASQRTEPDPAGPQPANFQAASGDGSRVFFLSNEKLVDGDPDNSPDLYLFDVESGDLRRLTGDGSEDPAGAGVLSLSGFSRDGSRAYFVAQGSLAPGAVSGNYNLYLWEEDGSGGDIAFLGTGFTETEARQFDFVSGGASTSPSGRYFAFESAQSLTGLPSGGNQQIYLFDAVERELVCASCSLAGGGSVGSADLGDPAQKIPSNVLDDGQLFFDTAQALLASDTNNRRDVYVYRNGHTQLISSGRGSFDAIFGDAGYDGADVYFVTRNRLVPGDVDANGDLYDARVGGGFPGSVEPAPCVAAACQEGPSAPPGWNGPAEAASGGGPRTDCGALSRKARRLDARASRLSRAAARLDRDARQSSGDSRLAARAREATRRAGKAKRQASRAGARAQRCRAGGSR